MSTVPASSMMTSASLYVGDLSPEVPEAKLFEMFNNIGQVQSVRVLRDHSTRRSLGYAYVNFHRVDDAEKAIECLNYTVIGDRPCRIMWSQRNPELRKSGKGNIFLKNLNKVINHGDLRDTFSRFGPVLSCKVAMAKGESLGYGFVHFADPKDAAKAIETCNGMNIGEFPEKVVVAPFVPKANRGGGQQFTNVYAKNLPKEVSEEKFNEMFAKFGTITSFKLVTFEEEKKTNYGFVNFSSAEEAKAAIDGLNNFEMGDKRLFVARAQKKAEREKELKERYEQLKAERNAKYQGVNLYVKNLSDQVDDAKLRELFAEFGTITNAAVMVDAKTKKSRGFGFVCFSSPDEAMKAVKKNGAMVDNKPLYVAMAQLMAQRRQLMEETIRNRQFKAQQPLYPNAFAPVPRIGYPGHNGVMWTPNQPGPMHMGPRPYQLVPSAGRGGPGGRPGRGGRGNQRGPNMRHQHGGRGGHFNDQARNNQRGPQQAAPAQVAEVPLESLGPREFASRVASLPDEKRKPAFGERLYPLVYAIKPDQAPKITGMLLEMDDSEIIDVLESADALNKKINEAVKVLEENNLT